MARLLNKDIRERIISAVLTSTFSVRMDRIRKKVDSFAAECYDRLVSDFFKEQVQALPREWFIRKGSIKVSYTPEQKNYQDGLINPHKFMLKEINGSIAREELLIELERSLPFPANQAENYSSSANLSLDGSEFRKELLDHHQAILNSAKKICREYAAMKEKLVTLLYSVKSVQGLVDIAPELKPFIPAFAFEERHSMPAPVVGTLITELMKAGLRLDQKEAA